MASPIRKCKDCSATATRSAPYPGPRCRTHHLSFKRKQKESNHDKYVQKQYGLKPGEYEKLYEFQNGKCYICQRATGRSKKLSVDHDHSCCPGSVSCGQCARGALCSTCNKALGHARDSIEFFQRAINYLESPPLKEMRTNAD